MNCRHHPSCPGCPLMGVPYSEQLSTKRARLLRALRRYPHVVGHIDLDAVVVRPAVREEGYRHRLKLPVQKGRNGVSIGLYAEDGRTVVNTPDCPVLAAPLREAMPALATWLAHRDGVHSIDLRVSGQSGDIQAVLACRGGELDGGARAARDLVRLIPRLTSLAVSRADKAARKVMGAAPRVMAGSQRISEKIGATTLSVHPGAFLQVDPLNAVQLHEMVAAHVGSAKRVLDLYSGVGAYGRMLARDGGRSVVAVEEVSAAVRSARHEAPRNFHILEGKVEDVLDRPELATADVAVLNPARKGSEPSVLRAMAARVERVVFVSCGPEALARDLDVLAASGMKVRSIEALDLFPQTAEVEAVVHLERARPLQSWAVTGGQATHPWAGRPSGALGKATELIALVIGDPGERGRSSTGAWRRLGLVAGHAVLALRPTAHPRRQLDELARNGHPLAGQHGSTDRFFAEKAGLQRPFLHVSRAGGAVAPLHGDLVTALVSLGATPGLLERAGARPEAAMAPRASGPRGPRPGGPAPKRGRPPRRKK